MKIKSVGIMNINYPVRLRQKIGGHQETVASISLKASMPHRQRETCVSSFIALLNKHQDDISVGIFKTILEEVRSDLEAESATIEMTFPYFIEKKAPITDTSSLMEYKGRFTGSSGLDEDFILSVWIPVTTLCPCSKEISEYGAHNQRAEINLNVSFSGFIWLEDLVTLVESGASCDVYALLKRPDEKFVTEQAYRNPMFVEDVVRMVAEKATAHPNITWFSVSVESFESIHKHSAYAFIDSSAIS